MTVGGESNATCFDAKNKAWQIEVAIGGISPGYAGARAGLAVGDRLLTYRGQKITSIRRFYDLVADPLRGYRVLTVQRGSQILEVAVPAGDLGISLVVVPDGAADATPTAAQAN
jgi:S1-C subfamily serine protease